MRTIRQSFLIWCVYVCVTSPPLLLFYGPGIPVEEVSQPHVYVGIATKVIAYLSLSLSLRHPNAKIMTEWYIQ